MSQPTKASSALERTIYKYRFPRPIRLSAIQYAMHHRHGISPYTTCKDTKKNWIMYRFKKKNTDYVSHGSVFLLRAVHHGCQCSGVGSEAENAGECVALWYIL